ncbi:similar to Lachancea lanzarotensis hypothetical protein LALA0S15e00254g1_1 [Maudiozyma saulgeensis]|uniref:Secreted protein CSS2 C-terminal domain-containing protein n=1 Tax=Maudiozyma saulgeensis TaxID=1789683 RepID=A0A1X7RBS9_9SACH|nr:similar to Lachancea lanzarotensis hypothetical protein LALA0S15e00254g1_1 [Kazachstania saulgeensis]
MYDHILYFSLLLIIGISTTLAVTTNESKVLEFSNHGNKHVVLTQIHMDLAHFENHTIPTNIDSCESPRNISWLDTSDLEVYCRKKKISSNSISLSNKPANISKCESLHLKMEKKVCKHRNIVNEVYQLGYDFWRSTYWGGCNTEYGSSGGLYYKYYHVEGDCSHPIDQKTVIGAIQYTIKELDDGKIRKTYFILIKHHGTWIGTMVIGSSIQAWYSNIGSSEYKGCWDNGYNELHSPFSCESKKDGSSL